MLWRVLQFDVRGTGERWQQQNIFWIQTEDESRIINI